MMVNLNFKAPISIDNSSKSKVTVEGLSDQKNLRKIENNNNIVKQNPKKMNLLIRK